MSNHSPLYFIHVPKTAGTSFRKAAEQYYSNEKICYDYGLQQPETSSLIRQCVYENNDFYDLKEKLMSQDVRMIGGHVPARRFAPIIRQSKIFTFVREPVSRLVSEYRHFKRHYNFKGEISDFIRRPEFRNRQFRMFQGFAPHMLGFIGITEQYSESLELFNHIYGTDLNDLSLNMAGQEKAPAHNLDEPLVQEIKKLNRQEIAHYEECKQLFEQRRDLFKDGMPFVHGQTGQYEEGKLFGWAFSSESDSPVELTIEVNGHAKANILANERRPGLLQLNVPRDGFVGYSAKVGTLKSEDLVRVFVTKTGQELANSPLKID